jgi:hypothetical protein
MRGSGRSGPVYLDVVGQQGVFPGETPLMQPLAQLISSGVSRSQSPVPPISAHSPSLMPGYKKRRSPQWQLVNFGGRRLHHSGRQQA